ncbi:MAG: ABC transporter permease [Thermomicrobiales bacterium]
MATATSRQPSRTDAAGRIRALMPTVLSSVGAVAIALLVGAVFILISNDNPIDAYRALVEGAFGTRRAIGESLVLSVPLIFTGLAFAIAFRAGMFNIGAEGQFVIGGLAAGLVGAIDSGMPLVVHLPLAILAAVVAGGIWGAIPGALKAWSGAHEVITTIMLNYLAFRVLQYSLNRGDEWLPVDPMLQATDRVQETAELRVILDGTRLHAGFILAIVVAVALWYVLFRTTFGYRIRTVGLSRGAAAYASISWGATIILAMFVSGLMAGLGGATETLGLQGRMYADPPGYGFAGIAVGLVGRNHPIGVVFAGLLFGVLRSGSTQMQNQVGTSKELVLVLQGLVILSVSAFAAIGRMQAWRSRRARPRETPGVPATVGVEPGQPPAA